MDDLLIIPKSVFYENVDKSDVVQSKIVKDILALDCFNELSKSFAAHVSKKTTYTHTPRQHFTKPQTRKVLSYHDKILREITGSMNKLNESNYESILKNMIKIVDNDNVEMVCKIILDKSILHSIYMSSFITLCLNIYSIYPDQVNNVIKSFVIGFVSDSSNILSNLRELDKENYDDFCLFIKKKNSLLSKTKLLCDLEKSFKIGDCFGSFWNVLLQEIKTDLETVILEIIVMLTSHCGEKSYNFIKDLESKVDVNSLKYTKSKFIFKDLLNINDYCSN